MSKIEWTNRTWNPVVGCSKVSAGCKNCYAIRMAWRLQHIPNSKDKYAGTVEKTAGGQLNWTGKVNIIEKEFVKPFTWRKPSMVFVNSESDLFHESVPFQVIRSLFGVMSVCKEHTFQILTKRPQRMLDFFEWLKLMDPEWQDDPANYAYDLCVEYGIETGCGSAFETDAWPLKNVWLGVSVEDQNTANERIPLLMQIPAEVRFLSCEPLLSTINFTLKYKIGPSNHWTENYDVLLGNKYSYDLGSKVIATKIDWVIAGGESGKDARPLHPEWVRSIRNQCKTAGTPFFFKQWGEWKPYEDGDLSTFDTGTFVDKPGEWGDHPVGTFTCIHGINWGTPMSRVGKKKAGRSLDGRQWNEFPLTSKLLPTPDDPDLFFTGGDY
ncbi:phage Gp37/Gp68 family protein [Niastella caeni]|uniref:Phage Gp37/Gp68 family protein n=1 Tax=Niastella caeni TaxID=2569763 RepID=A0A4S8HGR9_9BACT|nr:phage Gp37/Gp68 family protein [Niastella caeni]THU34227.1 phage Gp37/Gp68 family protein [Niastella caeni]